MDESTPLSSNGIPRGSEMNRFAANLVNQDNLRKAGLVVKSRYEELRLSIVEGDFSIRLLALFAGIVLIIFAFLDFFSKVFTFNVTGALLEVYAFLLGVLMSVLESRRLNLPEQLIQKVYTYALFLKFVWGRACLYFVAGSFQMTGGGVVDCCVGGFVMLVGLFYLFAGRQAASRLSWLKTSIYSEQVLRSKFEEADTEGRGKLSLEQFRQLLFAFGFNLSRAGSEAAFLCLDQNDSGEISYDEARAWWTDWEEETTIV